MRAYFDRSTEKQAKELHAAFLADPHKSWIPEREPRPMFGHWGFPAHNDIEATGRDYLRAEAGYGE